MGGKGFCVHFIQCVCVCMYVCVYMCMCVCMCVSVCGPKEFSSVVVIVFVDTCNA